MGANQSADLFVGDKFEETSFNIQDEAQFLEDIHNDLYGEAQLLIYKELPHQKYILKSKLIANKVEYDAYIKEPQKRKQIKSPFIIPILNIYQVKQSDYCSKYYKVYMLYGNYEKTLFDSIIEFNELQQTYTQEDILQMIENVLQGLIHLKDQRINHGMIKTNTIAIAINSYNNNQNNSLIGGNLSISSKRVNSSIQGSPYKNNSNIEIKYLISDSNFMHNGEDSYTQALLGEVKDIYLSPQLFSSLKHRDITPYKDNQNKEQCPIEKSTIFSLGMVAVEMATLKSVKKFYDFDSFCLNKIGLMNKLELISQLYSPQLSFIISKMLLFNEKERSTYSQALDLIHCFNENPSNFFDINFTPEMILENYQSSNTEDENQNLGQQINQNEIQDDTDVIKRAQKNQSDPKEELYTFKMSTHQGETKVHESNPGANIHVITNNTSRYDDYMKKSPNSQIREYSTPNKIHNESITPESYYSHQQRGLSAALDKSVILSNQNNNYSQAESLLKSSQSPQYYSEQNQNTYQINTSLNQNNSLHQLQKYQEQKTTPYSSTYIPNSTISGNKQSYRSSNYLSKMPSQNILDYDEPDYKLEKYSEQIPNQNQYYSNNISYQKRVNDLENKKKKSGHTYSKSYVPNTEINLVKNQENTSNKQYKQYSDNFYSTSRSRQNSNEKYKNQSEREYEHENQQEQINPPYNVYNQPMNEDNIIDYRQKIPNHQTKNNIKNNNVNTSSVAIQSQNTQKKQKQDTRSQTTAKKSGSSNNNVNNSKNPNKKQSPKNTVQSKNEESVKRAGPSSKSTHVSNPSSQGKNINGSQNFNMNQQIESNRNRQASNYSQKSLNQRNDDSMISIYVPNEIDMNRQEYPAQKIYDFDSKTLKEQKEKLLSPSKSSNLQKSSALKSSGLKYSQVNSKNCNSQKSLNPLSNKQINQPEQVQNKGDTDQPNQTQSLSILSNNHSQQGQEQNTYNYLTPPQSQKSIASNQNRSNTNNVPTVIQKSSNNNIKNGNYQTYQSVKIKEQLLQHQQIQNTQKLIQQNQKNNNFNFSKTQPLDIKSINQDKSNEGLLHRSLLNKSQANNNPSTPRKLIRENPDLYKMYQQSPDKEDLNFKLEKAHIPEEEYTKNLQKTISGLEQRIKNFDINMAKSSQNNYQASSLKPQNNNEEEKQSSLKKFLNAFSCKSNNNVLPDENNGLTPKHKTPLKNLFVGERHSPERFPIQDDTDFNPMYSQDTRHIQLISDQMNQSHGIQNSHQQYLSNKAPQYSNLKQGSHKSNQFY